MGCERNPVDDELPARLLDMCPQHAAARFRRVRLRCQCPSNQ